MNQRNHPMKRREFLQSTGKAGVLACTGLPSLLEDAYAFGQTANLSSVEARYYKKLPDREVECLLCPRRCRLGDRERGYCGVRENREGTYLTLVYGKSCSRNIDPVEKKPFFHFLPGASTLSVASAGCNVNCKFCQNWEISQVRPEQIRHVDFPPAEIVSTATANTCPIIAYTYSEPVVFFEYMYDTAVLAAKKGLRNAVVTGGHINQDPLADLCQVVDAIKIDLKSFRQSFYTQYVRGELKPVLEAIQRIQREGIWLELVYLVIPSLNDSVEEITDLSNWIANTIGPEVPLHFSRFHPMYMLKNLPPTPVSTLERCRNIALKMGLHYSYIGNVPGHEGENTICPNCSRILIERYAYAIRSMNIIEGGKCRFCGHLQPGVWS
jgi:pyruvate formate lyase activating enzyme